MVDSAAPAGWDALARQHARARRALARTRGERPRRWSPADHPGEMLRPQCRADPPDADGTPALAGIPAPASIPPRRCRGRRAAARHPAPSAPPGYTRGAPDDRRPSHRARGALQHRSTGGFGRRPRERRPEGGSTRGTHVRQDRDRRRQAAARSHRGARRQEPRHQGDGRGAARRDSAASCRTCPSISDVEVVTGMLDAYGVAVTSPEDGVLLLDPTNVERAHFARDRRARRLEPHPDPVLRTAAAPPRRGADPRPRRLPHRRPSDRLPHGCAARLRRDRRQELRGHPHHRARRPARRQHRAAVPERRSHRAGAADRGARRGRHRAQERGDRARDHGPHRDPAEDGRHHLDRAEPHHLHRGRRQAQRLHAPRASSTATRRRAGRAAALATEGDIFVGRREAARADDLPQRLPQGRRRVRRARGRHPVLPPGRRRSSRCASRPTCTPAS